ncbi:S66 family peptidase [Phytoactinopolyspora endophytica]|uniref:S66 family peptidase n=1 Tax=Phytoactinopolyspora endophytica TaxID=1642495 RepID=UPI00101C5ACF|nr:S66 peptidase family protein [Phytoactinopolyspora endophytica]
MPGVPVKPPALRPGDTVAVVSSSWGGPSVFPGPYEAGVRVLRDVFGLDVVEAETARTHADELARNPRRRAEVMNALITDDEVKAIISTIGGDDSVRILPWLDTASALAHPTIVMGYSDTAAQLVAYHLAGLVTYDGSSAMSGFAQLENFPDAVAHTRAMLFGEAASQRPYQLPAFERWTQDRYDWDEPANASRVTGLRSNDGWRWLHGDRVSTGRLFGGCVEVLEFLKGTRWWPNDDPGWWRDRVLFLETSEKRPTIGQVRRWLRNYGSQGVYEHAAALWIGRAYGYDDEQKKALDEAVVDIVVREFDGDLPIVANLDFGHTDPRWVLPLGITVETDPVQRTLRVMESPTTS